MSRESETFVIRPIERTDGLKIRYAVLDNQKRLCKDLPNVIKRYTLAETATAAAERAAQLTADQQSGFKAWVATDPQNTEIYGVGTSSELNRRQLVVLGGVGLHLMFSEPSAELIAGWEVAHAPAGLAQAGLNVMCTRKKPHTIKPVDVAKLDTDAWLTLIRPENQRALRLVQSAGMIPVRKATTPQELEVSRIRARAAGINDGVKAGRRLYVKSSITSPSMLRSG